jgi:hypothetical protein
MPEKVYTRPLLDKLGVAPAARVAIVGVDQSWFVELLAQRTHDVTIGLPEPDTDLVFLAADSTDDLDVLPELRRAIRPVGAIWVVSKKGKAATLRDVDVIEAAIAAGLVDNKVVAFSETETALRLVIRRRDRPGAAGAS